MRQATFPNPFPQVASHNQLRHDKAETIARGADVIDRNNVGMVEAGEETGFGQVRLGLLRYGKALRPGNLYGYRPVQLIVMGQVDATEASLAQNCLHSVATN